MVIISYYIFIAGYSSTKGLPPGSIMIHVESVERLDYNYNNDVHLIHTLRTVPTTVDGIQYCMYGSVQ